MYCREEIVGLAKHRNVFVEQFPQNSAPHICPPDIYLNYRATVNTGLGQHNMTAGGVSGVA